MDSDCHNGFTGKGDIKEAQHVSAKEPRRRSTAPKFDTIKALTYTWQDINVYPSKGTDRKGINNLTCFKKEEKKPKHILKNVTGLARPGELMAIMGASGAGKTTLLNILTCRNTGKLSLSGQRLVNGFPVDRTTIAAISSYIQQTDIFIGTLTPREHLRFQATLRMDNNIPYKERMQRVEEVIQEMGLSQCADTIIGIPGRVKGLSGGQQKRLSIASEILTDPMIMFCDEPTTGLDSFMAQSIIKSLKTLASRGKTIICTIHQPASGTYAQFDRLLLMSEGRTAFLGDCNDALIFFNDIGYPTPMEYNPADHYIFTLAIRPGNEEVCLKRASEICDIYEKTDFWEDVKDEVKVKDERSWNMLNKKAKSLKYKASWGTQFKACIWRSWKTVINDPLVLKVQLAQSIFLAIIIGLVFLGQDMDQEGIQNINGFIFMVIANLTFSSIFPVANVFWNELPVFIREHYNGTYRTEVYYLGKTLAELPVYLILPGVFMSIGYWMVGLNPSPDRFMIAVAVATLIANVASSFGYMISTVSSSLDMAMALAPVFIMPFFLFGGSFLNKDSIPNYFIWLKYLSWFLHGNEALSVNQWKGVENIECTSKINVTYCVNSGGEVLESMSFKEDNFFLAIGVLFALIFTVRFLSYLGLLAKTKNED